MRTHIINESRIKIAYIIKNVNYFIHSVTIFFNNYHSKADIIKNIARQLFLFRFKSRKTIFDRR